MRAIFRVLVPVPEIGALPGDHIEAAPADPAHPLVLTRELARGVLPLVLDGERFDAIRVEHCCRVEITEEGRRALAEARDSKNDGAVVFGRGAA